MRSSKFFLPAGVRRPSAPGESSSSASNNTFENGRDSHRTSTQVNESPSSESSTDLRPPAWKPLPIGTSRRMSDSAAGSSSKHEGGEEEKEERLDQSQEHGEEGGEELAAENGEQDSDKDSQGDRKGKGVEKNTDNELASWFKTLEKKITESRKESQARYQVLERQHNKLKQDYEESQKRLRDLREKHEKLKQDNGTGQKTKKEQDNNAAQLVVRDDGYFGVEFSKLSEAIQQWVFRNFRGQSKMEFWDFPEPVRHSVRSVVWGAGEPQIKIREIQAVVADYLTQGVLSRFQFGLLDQHLESACSFLGGTDLEKRKWYVQTVNMAVNNEYYKDSLHKGLTDATKYLKSCLDLRITVDREDCGQALFAIVEHAAKLSEEISLQTAIIQVQGIDPGVSYHPETMEDVSGTIDDGEIDERSGYRDTIIHKVLFPVVLRYGFDEAGHFLEHPIVIRKAEVIVLRLEGEEGDNLDF